MWTKKLNLKTKKILTYKSEICREAFMKKMEEISLIELLDKTDRVKKRFY